MITPVELVPRADGARLLPWYRDENGAWSLREWPRLILLDKFWVGHRDDPYRITVIAANGQSAYKWLRDEDEVISLWEAVGE